MFIVAKTFKGKEYIYNRYYTIQCKSEKQAKTLEKHLNENNESAIGDFKLKDNELWKVYQYEVDIIPPKYKLIETKGKIRVRQNW